MSKQKVAIVTDSTAYIPEALVRQHNLTVVPQILNWSGESLKDGVDITPVEFYERLKSARELPTTSQPSAGDFHETFSKVAETAESIVCIVISEFLSGTYASATAAADMLPDIPIEVVDSRTTAPGLMLMAMAAARAVEAGKDYRDVAQVARDLVPRIRVLFVVDTLEFLHRGGRIGGAQRLVGSLLAIKPLLHLENGRIESLESVRTKRKAVARLLDIVEAETAGQGAVRAVVLDAAAPEEGERLRAEVEARIKPVEMVRAELSPVVGTHAGPGTVGLGFYVEP